MNPQARVLLVVGSARPVRVGDQLAAQIKPILEAAGAEVTVADLAELGLPLLDEPVMAAASGGDYAHEHTRTWSGLVRDADAVVWLTPQYNGGYPASVKNAIDYLFPEWTGKPMLLVSYGAGGGGLGGAQLRSVLEFVKGDLVAPNVEISLPPQSSYGSDFRLVDAASDVERHRQELESAAQTLVAHVAAVQVAG